MSHPHFETQIDAYLDDELEAADARALDAHLAQCQGCAEFRDDRLALRAAIKTHAPALPAPDILRERVRAQRRSVPGVHSRSRFDARVVWRSLAVAASLAVVALGGWQLGLRRGAGEKLADAVLTAHIRSLMPGHLTDVASTDQHTVKPWFNGKLDYSPPVQDFAAQGYPLLGGRLDYIDGRSVSALAYGRRQHVINVLLWPRDRGAGGGPSAVTRQGYHVLHWATPDYSYWIVSDVGLPDLEEFRDLLRRAE